MEARNLLLTIISAENLPNVRHFSHESKIYAAVSLNGDPHTTFCSDVDATGGTNPTWNFKVGYTMVVKSGIEQEGIDVIVKMMCKRTLGDRLVGEVRIPAKSLFERGIKSEKMMSFDVEGSEGGRLNILYRFGLKIMVPKGSTSGKIVPRVMVPKGPAIGATEAVSIGFLVDGAAALSE